MSGLELSDCASDKSVLNRPNAERVFLSIPEECKLVSVKEKLELITVFRHWSSSPTESRFPSSKAIIVIKLVRRASSLE